MAKIVLKLVMDGETYRLMSDGMWVNSSFTRVSKDEMYKLDKLRLEETDINTLSFEDRVKMAQSLKDNGNLIGARKIFDGVLEECNEINIIKHILPCYTSLLRKLEKPEEAIAFAEEYLSIYKKIAETSALFTSLAGAYCDVGDYFTARKKANKAKALSGGVSSQELINVYQRINAMEK